jgi:hypothetical protein
MKYRLWLFVGLVGLLVGRGWAMGRWPSRLLRRRQSSAI